MTAGSSTVSASKMTDRWRSPPDSMEEEGIPVTREGETETWGERVFAAVPLFVVGAVCLALAIDLYYSGATTQFVGNSSVRLAPWALFLALAVTGLAAGAVALWIREESPAPSPPETVVAAPAARAGAPAPEWDESTLAPEKQTFAVPRTWEQYPDYLGPPVPSDFVPVAPATILDQIDEIAASLRRKPPPSGSP